MKFTAAATILAASAAVAAPTASKITDVEILNYALTLEHLENYFYSHYLEQFSAQDFAAAGFPDWVRGRISQIAGHEAQHVELLSGALGDAATKPCTYKFPVTDVRSFTALATIIENVGVSAYLGAASSITDPAYVTVAGSILTTEARHQAWLGSAVQKGAAWSGPEDTPLTFDSVYSIAAAFITECPSTNPALPVKAFPALAIAADGTVTSTVDVEGKFIAVYSGLVANTFPIQGGKVQGFPQVQGISYAILTSEQDATKISDDTNVLAGPFINFNVFNSKVANPAPAF